MSKYLNGTSIYTSVNSGLANSYNMLAGLYSDGVTLENLNLALNNSSVLQSSYGTTFASYMMNNFTSIDKDNDGVLSADDIQAYMNKISTQGLTQEQIITLGNSMGLSASLQETVLAHFEEIDANNDGKVTNAEIQAYNINSDLNKQKIEDINRSVNRLSLFTEGLTEHKGSIMDYRYASDNAEEE